MNSSIENKENVYNFSVKAADPKIIFVMNSHGMLSIVTKEH